MFDGDSVSIDKEIKINKKINTKKKEGEDGRGEGRLGKGGGVP